MSNTLTDEDPVAPAVTFGAPAVTDAPKPTQHVIETEDTIDSIADKYDLDPVTLHSYNSGDLDRQAIARGHLGGSEGGRILFPGSVISLVPVTGGNNQVGGSPAPAFSAASEIARMHQLLQAGVLTQAEFDAAKAKLLA